MGMEFTGGATREDGIKLVAHLLQHRPLGEAVREIDKHAALLPELSKVREKAVRGDRPGAVMELQICLSPDTRR